MSNMSYAGLFNPFVRWWVAFSVISATIVTALLAGIGNFILSADVTYISWVILVIFFGASIYVGRKAYRHDKWNSTLEFVIPKYCADTCTTLGLLGTIIGLIISILGAFSGLETIDQESIQRALTSISSGIGTALVTTMIGLITALLLGFQMLLVRGKNYD